MFEKLFEKFHPDTEPVKPAPCYTLRHHYMTRVMRFRRDLPVPKFGDLRPFWVAEKGKIRKVGVRL